jgi:uncharacterized membrane protein YdbT with pleckstrin-like domain
MESSGRIKTTFLLLMLLTLGSQLVYGQDAVEMADTLHTNGKIYVVIAVVAIVLLVLFVYLISIERKVKKLEDKVNKK